MEVKEQLHNRQWPGEDEAYREARNTLLQAELDLERHLLSVAKLRQTLPPGGALKEDYLFDEADAGAATQVPLSDLFASGKDTLVLYSFMFAPEAEAPCPACTSLVDGLNGIAQHLEDRVNLAIVAKAPIRRFSELAKSRGWTGLRLLSSAKNSYNEDYGAVNAAGDQIPAFNVFTRHEGQIRHFYNAEQLYVDQPGHPHHVDRLWPIWNLLDLTPEGRGEDWFPKLSY